MNDENHDQTLSNVDHQPPSQQPSQERQLSAAARRALEEAASRRAANYGTLELGQKELNGRKGPEAVRYGDWEKNGIISDF